MQLPFACRQEFFVYDMDDFTKQFYREVMGQQELEAVPVDKLPPPTVPLQVSLLPGHLTSAGA